MKKRNGVSLLLVLLVCACSAAGTAARADVLIAGHGVVHVWSEYPAAVVDPVLGYPAWGYRFHPNYAMVDCDIDPEEALVILDGEPLGEADDFDGFPSYLFIRPGRHQLEFRSPGCQPLTISGLFRSGAFIRVDRELEEGTEPQLVQLEEPEDVSGSGEPAYAPPTLPPDDGPAGPPDPPSPAGPAVSDEAGFLRLQVSPADAAVYIDDRFFGSGDEISRLHGYIRLAPGPHTIQVTRPGYQARTLPVEISVDEKQHLDVWLERAGVD